LSKGDEYRDLIIGLTPPDQEALESRESRPFIGCDPWRPRDLGSAGRMGRGASVFIRVYPWTFFPPLCRADPSPQTPSMRRLAVIHHRHMDWVPALQEAEPRLEIRGWHPREALEAGGPWLAEAEALFTWRFPEGFLMSHHSASSHQHKRTSLRRFYARRGSVAGD